MKSSEAKAVISPKEARARYDKAAKEILSLPILCALILKKTMPEIFSGDLEDIAAKFRKSLNGTSRGHCHKLRDQMTEIEKGDMSFDALLLYVCETADPDVLFVDVEVQNSNPGSRSLAGRIFYYIGEMFKSQKNDVSGFKDDEYKDIKPVCAIWIMPHMDHSFVIDCKTVAQMLYNDNERGAGEKHCQSLNDFVRIKIAAVGVNWSESSEEAIQCLGHIFRDSVDPERQIDYLEREGVKMTAQTRSRLDEYNDAQVVWLDPKMKREYDEMMTERDEYKSQLEWVKKNHPEVFEDYSKKKNR